jgi:hypothetical protein
MLIYKITLSFCGVCLLVYGAIGLLLSIRYDRYVLPFRLVDREEYMIRAVLSILGPWVLLPGGLFIIYILIFY